MTKKELKEMVASYISGQGTQLGVSDNIDDVLNGIWAGSEPYPEPWDIDVTLAINDSNIKNHLSSVEYRVFYKLI